MIKLHFFQYNNILFSKDRSVSRDLSFQTIKTRHHKKQKTKNKNNQKQTQKQKTKNESLFFHDRAFPMR